MARLYKNGYELARYIKMEDGRTLHLSVRSNRWILRRTNEYRFWRRIAKFKKNAPIDEVLALVEKQGYKKLSGVDKIGKAKADKKTNSETVKDN